MRVVSGTCKGRPLKAVPGTSTRPTTDKVKEAIFNMIGPYFNGGLGLDLFGGSGGLGIEGLSRGLDKVIFVDKDAKAIQTIKSNVESCDFSSKIEIYRNDALRAIKALTKRDIQFDLIFLDPPYHKQQLKDLIEYIEENRILTRTGFVVAEHATEVDLPQQINGLMRTKFEKYGISAVSIFQYDDDVEGGNIND